MTGPIRVRKRPIEVDAYRYTGDNADAVSAWVGPDAYIDGAGRLIIRTLEGDHIAEPDDWVMRGTRGEHYPIKPVIFEDVYDVVPS